MKHFPVFYH
ncbi:MAG: hypothetical protein QG611_902, partial [Bacteroidota bacterium]|nr:hypothetical protein [Bacteroidota bacterium]